MTTNEEGFLDYEGLRRFYHRLKPMLDNGNLKYPTGAILNLNPKNCTTDSIKTANGVIDGSGYGHHGQAFGGVSVLDGGEGFGFDGANNSYINVTNNMIDALSANLDALTITARVKTTSTASTGYIVMVQRSGYSAAELTLVSGKGSCGGRVNNGDAYKNCNTTQNINDGNWHTLTSVLRYSEGTMEIYLDGVLSNTGTLGSRGTFVAPTVCYISATNNGINGSIADIRIYPRALSSVEVKSLYIIPQETGIIRVTSDVIGINAVNSEHLNSDSVTADKLDVSSRIPNDCIAHVTAKGIARSFGVGDVIPELVGNYRGKLYNAVGWTTYYSYVNKGEFFYFNGTNNSLMLFQSLRTQRLSNNFSISFWATNDDLTYSPCYCDLENNLTPNSEVIANRIFIGATSGRLIRFVVTNNAGTSSVELNSRNVLQLSKLTHITCTYSGTILKIYIDGVLDNTRADGSHGALSLTSFSLGLFQAGMASRRYTGAIADFRIYNRTLSDNEVMALYKAGTDTESGQISSDRLSPDAVTSRNYNSTTVASYFSTAGFSYNLADGSLKGKFLSFNETNGYYAGTTVSRCDREIKSKISKISTLNKLKQLDIYSWKYDRDKIAIKEGNKPEGIGTTESPMNIAPMAQDFNKLFGVCFNGEDYIDHLDMIGVALQSIKELAYEVDELKRQIRAYKRILNITDEQIMADRDAQAIKLLKQYKDDDLNHDILNDEGKHNDVSE